MNANENNREFLNALRRGAISAVDGALCRVSSGELESDWIQWFALAAGAVAEWRQPSIGEGAMLLCPSGDPAQAVALVGTYSDAFPAPSNNPNAHVRLYPDGATITYDFENHELTFDLPADAVFTVNAPGSVKVFTTTAIIKAEDTTIDSTNTTVTGAMVVKGPFRFESGMSGIAGSSGGPTAVITGTVVVSEDVVAGGTSTHGHVHREQGDGELVSPPVNGSDSSGES
jgi:phage baseplate assembly protein V